MASCRVEQAIPDTWRWVFRDGPTLDCIAFTLTPAATTAGQEGSVPALQLVQASLA